MNAINNPMIRDRQRKYSLNFPTGIKFVFTGSKTRFDVLDKINIYYLLQFVNTIMLFYIHYMLRVSIFNGNLKHFCCTAATCFRTFNDLFHEYWKKN